jgi:hypothetical protein
MALFNEPLIIYSLFVIFFVFIFIKKRIVYEDKS